MTTEQADLFPTVYSARSVLTSLAATLEQREPINCAALSGGVLGTWSTGQDVLMTVIAAVDAIRVNTEIVPQSLRSFLA
ncbi:hypothetical protein [uncultured Jatrophihabitans sp.]|uniref:hypothetical protein n=1 Tax=uncultured Jatrophihabitans sp. TaxID=1610747 RepID=UPI0035C9FDD4